LRIDIVTVLPKLLESPLNESILLRAQKKGKVEIHIHNLRDFGHGKHRQVDDKPYGGSAGMVLMIEPVSKCIDSLIAQRQYDEIIYTTPDGKTLDQSIANQLSLKGNILILCGHYKGIDQRIRDKYITLEISIGDYVLTGGELAACVIVDSIVRLIPGVISNEESALSDSFQDGLLSPPVYTRPAEFDGMKVPDVLMSGHFGEIAKWQEEQAYLRTKERRPDLLDENENSLDSD
jgi:tRNA (guanine37-N1)-methyltransferase